MKTKSIRITLCALLWIMLSPLVCSNVYAANEGIATGRIINSKKEPQTTVSVSIEGLPIGMYTDEKGTFRITNIPTGKQVIVVSGFEIKPLKIPVNIVAGKELKLGDITVENQTLQLDEVQVVGKSEVRRMQEQAFAISALDIKKSHQTSASLNKLLNNVSSVRIREEGGMGSGYNFSLNGFSGNQVKFFLDGMPMDHFGTSFNLSNISANLAERIEVYKGVLPVSLGTDALGGAVNIVSRKTANFIDASYSIGSFNTHKVSLNGAYTHAKSGFTVRANAFYNYSDNNYKVYVPIVNLSTNEIIDYRNVPRFNNAYQAAGLRLETGLTNRSFADYLLFGIIVSQDKNHVQTGATMDAVYGGVRTKGQSVIPSIRYKKDDLFTEGLSLSLYTTYGDVDTYTLDTLSRRYNWLGESVPSTTAGERYLTNALIKNHEWIGSANLSYLLNAHHSFTLNHLSSAIKRTSNDKAHPDDEMNNIPQRLEKHITGLGWQIRYDRWNTNLFAKRYGLNSSTYKRMDEYTDKARWEKVRDSKQHWGYGLASTYYILPSLQAKVSYEQSYRMPESIEMFGDGLIQQRNPDLKPENSKNLNIGLLFDKIIGDHHLSGETNFIYRNTKDFILKGVDLTSNPTTGYDNLGKVLTQGIEGGFRYEYKEWLHLGGNATYQNIIDRQEFITNEGSFVGQGITENITYKERLPNIPYLFANGDLGFRFKDVGLKNSLLTVDYALNYVHEYYLSFPGLGSKASKKIIPSQLSHDLAIGYQLGGGRYGITLECTNLTNERLYDNYLLQKPGRAFNFKFRYYISK